MAIIGSILGDIAGSQYEFPITRPTRLDWRYCNLFTDRCKFTDDTVMTLAVKFAIKNNKSFGEVYRNLGRKYQEVGYGEKFRDWLSRDDDKAYYSFGNGAAMRCSYIGEYFDSENEVEEWAIKSAECTHNHPEGIKGAITTAMCVYMARTGATKDEIFQYVKLQYPLENYHVTAENRSQLQLPADECVFLIQKNRSAANYDILSMRDVFGYPLSYGKERVCYAYMEDKHTTNERCCVMRLFRRKYHSRQMYV